MALYLLERAERGEDGVLAARHAVIGSFRTQGTGHQWRGRASQPDRSRTRRLEKSSKVVQGVVRPGFGLLLPSSPLAKAKAPEGLSAGSDGGLRCRWCAGDPLYESYHDREWGFPVHDDVRLFEKICLEGFQAGLSWITILRKREAFRRAFHGFDPARVARMNARSIERLLRDESIVRHRGKLESAVHNAKLTLALIEERGSLAAHLWSFEPRAAQRPKQITWRALRKLTETEASRALSKD